MCSRTWRTTRCPATSRFSTNCREPAPERFCAVNSFSGQAAAQPTADHRADGHGEERRVTRAPDWCQMKRLSGWDAMLLYSETPNLPSHTLKIAILDDSAGLLTF